MSGDQETRQIQLQQSVATLRDLLQRLYPDEPSPDILTVDDFLYRFKLKESSPRAINAIKQSQRINRAIGRHRQTGLCEFHIGLIYLHWGDCLGACQQFAEARRHWSFVDEMGSICLTHFAEGRAYHHAYHYETAMASYGKAEQLLGRVSLSPPSDVLTALAIEVGEQIKGSQEVLRQAMWALQHDPSVPSEAPTPPIPEHATPPMGTAVPLPTEPSFYAPAPIDNVAARPEEMETPVPGHTKDHGQYSWYRVAQLRNALFPKISEGTWLLVHHHTEDHMVEQGTAVVVLFDSDINDGILVVPQNPTRSYQRIYLARWEEPVQHFTRDTTGRVTLSPAIRRIPVTPAELLGVVKGIWLEAVETLGLTAKD